MLLSVTERVSAAVRASGKHKRLLAERAECAGESAQRRCHRGRGKSIDASQRIARASLMNLLHLFLQILLASFMLLLNGFMDPSDKVAIAAEAWSCVACRV